MTGQGIVSVALTVIAVLTTAACRMSAGTAQCSADPAWLPVTPAPTFDGPPPPHPAPDCPFYQAAWQVFLSATQPTSSGDPGFLSYPTIEQTFGRPTISNFAPERAGLLSLAPRTIQTPNGPRAIGAGVTQAGILQGLLIDQAGNPVYYAIHMNDRFVKFLKDNNLTSPDGIKAYYSDASKDEEFPRGVVELKSAWRIVQGSEASKSYLTCQAMVPTLKVIDGKVSVDASAPPRQVTVELLAIHVVFTLKGHPEFVWSTFEHVDENGMPDTAPSAPTNPKDIQGDPVLSRRSFDLYKANSTYAAGNKKLDDGILAGSFDAATQRFAKNGMPQQTSVFRLYPASKSLTTAADDDVTDLNASMGKLFAAKAPTDKRRFYRLVGAVWLNNPPRDFLPKKALRNAPGQDPDGDSVVAGEDRLSSTAIESFTQDDPEISGSVSGQPNCFSCHDTRDVFSDLDPNRRLLKAKKINVSHIISRFVAEGMATASNE